MQRNILWIDDSNAEREAAKRMLQHLDGVRLRTVPSSSEAERVLLNEDVHCIVTDILRRDSSGQPSLDDGYAFFKSVIRVQNPTLPVIFHTKNLPTTFEVDLHSQYLSKWEPEEKKAIELEARLSSVLTLYEAFADLSIWKAVEPRLVTVQSALLDMLGDPADAMRMTPGQFEQLVAELLQRIGFTVLWIPGGNDQGIDIVAKSDTDDFLIDVKRYSKPVEVDLVRMVYGVASAAGPSRRNAITHGGIITSSRFTKGALDFQKSVRVRPLLRDREWLIEQLRRYAPRVRRKV
jgi:CheY-like chemotaxis protein